MSNEWTEIPDRIVKFSARIIKLVNAISGTSAGKKISDQLVRCGTSIGANYEEAHGAQSRADFAHKMQIALKEARETRYWLCVILEAELAPGFGVEALVDEATQLRAILGKSVATIRGTAKPSPSKSVASKPDVAGASGDGQVQSNWATRALPKSSPPPDRQTT
jgi:four helix bundle protein